MINPLGINFYRAVREEGENKWIQVVVRMPLVEEEMLQKGGLFGLIWGDKSKNWTDDQLEVFNFVEQEFHGHDENLAVWHERFVRRFGGIGSCWWWIKRVGNKREVSLVYECDARVVLVKNGEKVDFSKICEPGKVVIGEVNEGETWYLVSNLDEIDVFDKDGIGEDWGKEGVEGAVIKIEVSDLETSVVSEVDVMRQEKESEVVDDDQVEVKSETLYGPEVPERESGVVSRRMVGKLSMVDRVKNLWLRSKKSDESAVSDTKKTRIAYVGLVLLLMFVVSLGIGWRQMEIKKQNQINIEFETMFDKKLSDLNIMIEANSDGAKSLWEQTLSDVELAESRGVVDANVLSNLRARLEDIKVLVMKEKDSEFGVEISLDLIRSEFQASRIQRVSAGYVLVLDEQNGLLFGVDLQKQDIKVLAGKPKTSWIAVDRIGDQISLLSERSIESDTGEVRAVFDSAVIKPVSLDSFGTNLYVLDQGASEIYRFGSISGKLGERVRWLKPGVTLGLDKPVDMAVDVDIYVVGDTDSVYVYRRGERYGSPMKLDGGAVVSRIAVERGGERLAVLDNKKEEIVIIKKETGERLATYTGKKVALVQDLEFDENGGLWVVLSGKLSKIK
jgi:hypothetical protein